MWTHLRGRWHLTACDQTRGLQQAKGSTEKETWAQALGGTLDTVCRKGIKEGNDNGIQGNTADTDHVSHGMLVVVVLGLLYFCFLKKSLLE